LNEPAFALRLDQKERQRYSMKQRNGEGITIPDNEIGQFRKAIKTKQSIDRRLATLRKE
jgi:hypothetical protein